MIQKYLAVLVRLVIDRQQKKLDANLENIVKKKCVD